MQQNLTRQIINAIMAGKEADATALFSEAMAFNVKEQIEDYKAIVGKQMFEAAEDIGGEFIPVKKDFTIDAIDPSKKSERFPEGEPVRYKTNAFSPRTAYSKAAGAGHTDIKITDNVGNDVTHEGKGGIQLKEDTGVGAVSASLTAQRIADKKEENLEAAHTATQQKAPTIQDVVSVLGNTVSVADTSVVNN